MIEAKFEGDPFDRLKALQDAGENMQDAYAAIGNALIRKIRLGFRMGRDPWETPWDKLKHRRGQPLRDTGLLQKSINARVDAYGVTIGTAAKQAKVHQFGATIVPVKAKILSWKAPDGTRVFAKSVTIPARPFLPLRGNSQNLDLPPAWRASILEALRAHFAKEVA